MTRSHEQPLRILSLDGGGIRGLSSLIILGKIMHALHPKADGQEPKPRDYFRFIAGAGMGGVLALLLGRVGLTVSQCMSAYWQLSSLILRGDDYGAQTPLFDTVKMENLMTKIVEHYCGTKGHPDGLVTLSPPRDDDAANATNVCVYGVQKGTEGEYVRFRTYDSVEETGGISIAKAAVAISAARGLFAEVPLQVADGSKILCLDKGYPLGLIDPTKLALDEVGELFPGEEIHTIISVGSGQIAVQDIPDLLRLAYPSPFLRVPWPFQHRVPKHEISRVNEGLKNPQHEEHSLDRYRRFQIGPVEDVGPNDFLSIKEVSNATKNYLERIRWDLSRSLLEGTQKALHWAACTGQEDMVVRLLMEGAEVNLMDEKKRTPLSYAAQAGDMIVTQLLIDKGGGTPTAGDPTPLLRAAENGHEGVVKLLLDKCGINVDSKDNDGRTALSWSAGNGHEGVVKLLLDTVGIKVELKDKDGRTPLSWATEKGHKGVVKLLREKGADDSSRGSPDVSGDTKRVTQIESATSSRSPPTPVTSDSIDDECTRRFVVDTLENPGYLRKDAWSGFLSQDNVKATIEKELGATIEREVVATKEAPFWITWGHSKQTLVDYSLHNQRVFLTLAATSLIKKLPHLCAARFRDEHLPVERKHGQETDSKLEVYSVKEPQRDPWQCFAEAEEEERGWRSVDVENFVSKQWLFSAVTFDNSPLDQIHEIHENCPLPYIDLPNNAGLGRVFKLGLQKAHMNSTYRRHLREVIDHPLRPYDIAVKQLHIEGATEDELENFFKKETKTLQTMRELHDEHLIEAVAVYKKGSDRCIVFPWAPKGNLREYWNSNPEPANGDSGTHPKTTRKWALNQIKELTDGLMKLHARNTSHGDLKPENILVFESKSESGLDLLVIADMGVSKFYAEETRIRRAPEYESISKGGILRYEPPEIQLSASSTISTKSDLWSLGCVLLECIIWLVHGTERLRTFHEERLTTGSIDRFWDQDEQNPKKAILHPAASRWIEQTLGQNSGVNLVLKDLLKEVDCNLLQVSKDERSIQKFGEGVERIFRKWYN